MYADPDPTAQINADPCGSGSGYGSETLTYVQQMWGIIGHVTVEAGNTVGTDGAPPEVPPNSAAAGSEVESVRRSGGAERAAG